MLPESQFEPRNKKSLAFLLHWFPKKQVLKFDSKMTAIYEMIHSAIGQDGFPVLGYSNIKLTVSTKNSGGIISSRIHGNVSCVENVEDF